MEGYFLATYVLYLHLDLQLANMETIYRCLPWLDLPPIPNCYSKQFEFVEGRLVSGYSPEASSQPIVNRVEDEVPKMVVAQSFQSTRDYPHKTY